MDTFSAMHATAVVFTAAEGEVPTFSGSGFLYGDDDLVITAAHCVPEGRAPIIFFPHMRELREVIEVHRHPSADVCLLVLSESLAAVEGIPSGRKANSVPRYAFWPRMAGPGFGTAVMAFGYPGERTPIEGPPQQPRLFRGHVQSFYPPGRISADVPHVLLELSFPAPAGLSGGPVFRPERHDHLLGVVLSNIESETELTRTEEVDDDGKVYRDRIVRHVSYGLFLALEDIHDWLDEWVPQTHLREE